MKPSLSLESSLSLGVKGDYSLLSLSCRRTVKGALYNTFATEFTHHWKRKKILTAMNKGKKIYNSLWNKIRLSPQKLSPEKFVCLYIFTRKQKLNRAYWVFVGRSYHCFYNLDFWCALVCHSFQEYLCFKKIWISLHVPHVWNFENQNKTGRPPSQRSFVEHLQAGAVQSTRCFGSDPCALCGPRETYNHMPQD